LVLDGLKKRLYIENDKKGGEWIHELPLVVWSYALNVVKSQGSHLSFLSTGQKLSFPLTLCRSLQDWRYMKKVRQMRQDNLNSTPQKKSDATSKKDLSTLAIWSSVASKTTLGYISSTRG
jgi:hypothetical protein